MHIIWDLGQGGAQTYLYDLVSLQKKYRSVEPEVLILFEGGPIKTKLEKLKIPMTLIGMRHGLDLPKIAKLRYFLKKCDHDIIHTHAPNIALHWILKFIQKPKVFTEHGGKLLGGTGGWRNKIIYNALKNSYDVLIAISYEMKARMVQICPSIENKIVVVYNGIDFDHVDSLSIPSDSELPNELTSNKFKIGIIGRLTYQKGIPAFIETAHCLNKMHDNLEFIVIGDGELRSELENLVSKLGLKNNLVFLGYRTDAKQLLKKFDIFLFTSNFEPFGLVLLEAMAARIPIVALHLKGAVPEIINHGEDGLIVYNKDPQLLAESVSALIKDSDLRNKLTTNAHLKVKNNFTMQSNSDKILALYKNII